MPDFEGREWLFKTLEQHIKLNAECVWKTPSSQAISYPEDGNRRCFFVEDQSFWFRHRNDCIAWLVDTFVPNGFVLDIGGGNGFVTQRLVNDGIPAILVEPGIEGALNAKRHRKLPIVIQAGVDELAFLNGSCGGVGCFDVLEHVKEEEAFLDLVYGLLKPGGTLWGTVPAHKVLWSYEDIEAGHFRRYNEKKVRNVLAKRFEVVFFSYLFSSLFFPVLLMRSIPFKIGLKRQRVALSDEIVHGASGGVSVEIIKNLLKNERKDLGRGKTRFLGTSCLFAAKRI